MYKGRHIEDIMKNIFVINIASQTDRYASFKNEMKYFGMNKYNRIEAVVPHDGIDYNTAIKHSHIKCMNKGFCDDTVDYITVCEDDMYFDKRFVHNSSIIEDIYTFIHTEEWFIFYLGICIKKKHKQGVTLYKHIKNTDQAKGTYCYLISRTGMQFFIKNYYKDEYANRTIKGKRGTAPLDVTYLKLMHPTGKCFLSSPRIVYPDFTSIRYSKSKYERYMACAVDKSIFDRV